MDLVQAIINNDDLYVLLSLKKGINVNARYDFNRTLLMYAAMAGNIVLLEQLISTAADVNMQDDLQYTALKYAVENNHCEAAMLLLQHGADISHQDFAGETVLMAAARLGSIDMVNCLLDYYPDVYIKDVDGNTVLDIVQKEQPPNNAVILNVLYQYANTCGPHICKQNKVFNW